MTTSNAGQHPSVPTGWHLTDDLTHFLTQAGPFLHSRPALHTLTLTLAETLRICGPHAYGPEAPVLGMLERGDEICATLFRAPPHRLNLTSLTPEEADTLAAHMAGLASIRQRSRLPDEVDGSPCLSRVIAGGAFACRC
ncbi:hypothetical protein ACFYX0_40525, partial [Streptomyces sp. NPDC002573]